MREAVVQRIVRWRIGDQYDEPAAARTPQRGVIRRSVVILWGQLRRGAAATTTDVVRVLTGREPRTVAEFVRDHAAAFRS